MSIPKEVELLIEKSGNTFHAKVARWFKENGWHVAVSPYYMDQTQVKAREIDLIAERLWPAFDQYGKPSGHIAVQLFIECKYIPSYSVIWLAERDMKKAEKIVDRAIPLKFSFAAGHHYLSERAVAKLFASQRGGKAQHEPRSGEDDPLYKAVNQVLNGMVSLRGRPSSHPDSDKKGIRKKSFEFPVVVCKSFNKMFSVQFFSDTSPKPVEENFQLEVEYTYVDVNRKTIADYFLIDFVSWDLLAEFQQALEVDVAAAEGVLRYEGNAK